MKFTKGIPLPDSYRKKQADAIRGKKRPEWVRKKISEGKKGNKNPMFGKKPSDEHRKKISETLKRIKAPLRNLLFQEVVHNIRHSVEYKIWREKVFARDEFRCIWCFDSKGGNLNADHIKPFSLILKQNRIISLEDALKCKELWDLFNGRTLCKKCHKLRHSI